MKYLEISKLFFNCCMYFHFIQVKVLLIPCFFFTFFSKIFKGNTPLQALSDFRHQTKSKKTKTDFEI